MKQERIIKSIDEIKRIESEIHLFSVGKKERIRAQLPLFTEKENRQIGHKIEKHCLTCGRSGITRMAVITIFAMVLLTATLSVIRPEIGTIMQLCIGSLLVIFFSGKLYRLRKARHSLRAFADELKLKLD